MNFYEFGKENKKAIVLLHPLGVDWEFFSYVYPKLAESYHVIIPAVPGMDLEAPDSEFTSIEEIANDIEDYLIENRISELECIYGCSMGGGITIRMIANGRIRMNNIIVDAGITPYRLSKFLCFFIAVGDFFMTSLGKLCSPKMLGYMFDPDKYTKEDFLYIKSVLNNMTFKTIWRAFWSTDNYSMPNKIHQPEAVIHYWYGENEKKARKLDIAFMKDTFEKVKFTENKGQDHAEYVSLHQDEFCEELLKLLQEEKINIMHYDGMMM